MAAQNELDTSICTKCGHKFVEDEPIYAVNGNICVPCYEDKDSMVDIAGHRVSQKLLREYAEAVEAVRRGAVLASSRTDPIMLMKREQNRVAIHKRIFEAAGVTYEKHHWDGNTFQTELAKWLEANTLSLEQETKNLTPTTATETTKQYPYIRNGNILQIDKDYSVVVSHYITKKCTRCACETAITHSMSYREVCAYCGKKWPEEANR